MCLSFAVPLFRIAVSLAGLLCSSALAFQSAPADGPVRIMQRARPAPVETEAPRADLSIDASLVMIPVHVTTEVGTSVTNLNRESFRLFEDSVEQKITVFAKDDAPVSIGILFDTSASMQNKMSKSMEAVAKFFETTSPDDEFFLVEFSDRPKLTVPFTSNSAEVARRIGRVRPTGCTSLYDAIQVALGEMKKARNPRKAIVIFSDGGDNRSRHTFRQIKSSMLEADVLIYAMGIFDPDEAKRRTQEERKGPQLLDELTEESGGRHFPVDNLNNLPEISARIGTEIRNQYLLGYSPDSAARDGKYRRVKLSLVTPSGTPPLRVQYRQGYYAPAQ